MSNYVKSMKPDQEYTARNFAVEAQHRERERERENIQKTCAPSVSPPIDAECRERPNPPVSAVALVSKFRKSASEEVGTNTVTVCTRNKEGTQCYN